jgi:hypothetical protein
MDTDRKETGFVGQGLMGSPMAANLLKAVGQRMEPLHGST